jgi:phenolic acid decarboxylase
MPDEIPTCPKCGYPESPREQWCLECKESVPGKKQWMADFINLQADSNAEWELMPNYVVEKFIRSLLEEVFEECMGDKEDSIVRDDFETGYEDKREEIKEIKNKYL